MNTNDAPAAKASRRALLDITLGWAIGLIGLALLITQIIAPFVLGDPH